MMREWIDHLMILLIILLLRVAFFKLLQSIQFGPLHMTLEN